MGGVQALHAIGQRMLKLTNEVFSEQPSSLHQLTCAELLKLCRVPAGEVAALCTRLEQEANAAARPVAAEDLRRIGVATGRWLAQIEKTLARNGR